MRYIDTYTSVCVLHYHNEGTMSHISYICLFFLLNLENERSENDQKLPVFIHKKKSKA